MEGSSTTEAAARCRSHTAATAPTVTATDAATKPAQLSRRSGVPSFVPVASPVPPRGRRPVAESLVQDDLLAERSLQLRKPPHECFQPAVLAVLLTQEQFGIHEIQSAFRYTRLPEEGKGGLFGLNGLVLGT